jgi:hypothetical protein
VALLQLAPTTQQRIDEKIERILKMGSSKRKQQKIEI